MIKAEKSDFAVPHRKITSFCFFGTVRCGMDSATNPLYRSVWYGTAPHGTYRRWRYRIPHVNAELCSVVMVSVERPRALIFAGFIGRNRSTKVTATSACHTVRSVHVLRRIVPRCLFFVNLSAHIRHPFRLNFILMSTLDYVSVTRSCQVCLIDFNFSVFSPAVL